MFSASNKKAPEGALLKIQFIMRQMDDVKRLFLHGQDPLR